MSSERRLGRSLKQLNRDVYNILRRVGPAPVVIPAAGGGGGGGGAAPGAGPYGYDYLVDKNWAAIVAAGGGHTEGEVFTTFHGHIFYVYSNIVAAFADLKTRFSGSDRSIGVGVVPGDYSSQGTIVWPDSIAGLDDIEGVKIFAFSGNGFHSAGVEVGSINFPNIPAEVDIEGIAIADLLMTTGEFNVTGNFTRCNIANIFLDSSSTLVFAQCKIGSLRTTNVVPDDIKFIHCEIGFVRFSEATNNCSRMSIVGGSLGISFLDSNIAHVLRMSIVGVDISGKLVIDATDTIDSRRITIVGNIMSVAPASGSERIKILGDISSESYEIAITGNSFTPPSNDVSADTCYVRITGVAGPDDGPVYGVLFANNVLGIGSNGNGSIEDRGGFSVIGDFVDQSVFGPNSPVGKSKYKITNAAALDNLFIPCSADVTGPPGSGSIDIGCSAVAGGWVAGGEVSGILSSILVESVHSGSPHHDPDTTLLSGTFAIDSTGIKTLTVPHGLGYTPAVKEVQLTVAEDTPVDDWGFNLLKVISVDSVNVVAKVNVSSASGTGGATAKLAILLVGISVGTQASRSMGWYQQHPTPKVMRKPQPRWLNIPYEIIGGDIGVPIPSFGWFEQPPTRSVMIRPQPQWLNSAYVLPGDIGGLGPISIEWYLQQPPAAPRRQPGTREGIAVIAPSQLP